MPKQKTAEELKAELVQLRRKRREAEAARMRAEDAITGHRVTRDKLDDQIAKLRQALDDLEK